ncbi:MAG: hypothetical protein PGN07_12480 [Aeromicrobium erythreum]
MPVLRDVVDGLGDTPSAPVSRLSRSHRFAGAIGDLAEAVVAGDAARTLAVLARDGAEVRRVDPAELP